MKRLALLALAALLLASPAAAQQPVTITNVQAVDYLHDASLSLGSTSGPVMMCRTSTTNPTDASGDTRAFAVWCSRDGAIHIIATDSSGNELSGSTKYYLTSAASTNSTSVKGSAGKVTYVHVTNTTGTTYYLRMYNLASAPTCSSATGFVESMPIFGTNVNRREMPIPDVYSTGIGFCLTGGGSSTDNTNAATGVYIALGTI